VVFPGNSSGHLFFKTWSQKFNHAASPIRILNRGTNGFAVFPSNGAAPSELNELERMALCLGGDVRRVSISPEKLKFLQEII
jgi:hypothetical protein